MTQDATRLGVTISQQQETVWKAIVDLSHNNHRPEGMARVSFVKNTGGLWAAAEDRPASDLLIFTRELVQWPAAHHLRLQSMGIFSAGQYAGTKILSWVAYAAALEKAHAEGFDDALLVNEKGHLAECTSANFFLVRKGRVLTPPLSSGCLPGVTRDVLKEVVPQAGFALDEKDLTPDDLSTADEVFISSTTREVAGVGSISPNWKFQAPGRITRALEDAFQQYVKSHLKRTPAPRE